MSEIAMTTTVAPTFETKEESEAMNEPTQSDSPTADSAETPADILSTISPEKEESERREESAVQGEPRQSEEQEQASAESELWPQEGEKELSTAAPVAEAETGSAVVDGSHFSPEAEVERNNICFCYLLC